MNNFTHFNKEGSAQMVDVSEKAITKRVALAKGIVYVKKETLNKILDQDVYKGDVLEVARIAGIMGGKKTADLIPMCHPILISKITIEYAIDQKSSAIHIYATTKTTGQTGIEVEALTAVSITGLTIYDMCKAIDRSIRISDIELLKKSGGKSGLYLSDKLQGRLLSAGNYKKGTLIKEKAIVLIHNREEEKVINFLDLSITIDLNINEIPKTCNIRIGHTLVLEIINKDSEYLKCLVIQAGKVSESDEIEVIFND